MVERTQFVEPAAGLFGSAEVDHLEAERMLELYLFFKYTRIIIYLMEQELAALTGPRLAVVPELVEAAPGIHPGKID